MRGQGLSLGFSLGVLKLGGEDRRGPKGRERGTGSWRGGSQPAPSPPARGSGERCKLSQRGPGRSPGRQAFSCILWTLTFPGISVASGHVPVATYF